MESGSIVGQMEKSTAGIGSIARCMERAVSSGRTVLGSIEASSATICETVTGSICGHSALSHIEASGKMENNMESDSSAKRTLRLSANLSGRTES